VLQQRGHLGVRHAASGGDTAGSVADRDPPSRQAVRAALPRGCPVPHLPLAPGVGHLTAEQE
jgi:hypothetical protein